MRLFDEVDRGLTTQQSAKVKILAFLKDALQLCAGGDGDDMHVQIVEV